MAKARTPDAKTRATADHKAPRATTAPETAHPAAVAQRAYDLYQARGCEDGHDVEDWLQAERELHGAAHNPSDR